MNDITEALAGMVQALVDQRGGLSVTVSRLAARKDPSDLDKADLELFRAELARVDEDLAATRQRVSDIADFRRSSAEAAAAVTRFGINRPGPTRTLD